MARDRYIEADEPCFAIGVAARMVGLHAQTLRYYERAGLVSPSRTKGRNRLYSAQDIARLRKIRELTEDLGLNLAGVEVILRMMDRMARMEEELERLRRQLRAAGVTPRLGPGSRAAPSSAPTTEAKRERGMTP